MRRVVVVRVEDRATRKGPYQTYSKGWVPGMGRAHNDARHPAPHLDHTALVGPPTEVQIDAYEWQDYPYDGQHPRLYIEEGEFCGFASIKQAQKWFAGWGEQLEDYGNVLRMYSVPERSVRYGERQVVFRREEAELLLTASVTSVVA